MLHGAGGQSADSISLLGREAEARGIIIIAPKSRGATWDVIQGGFGPDVRAIDHALDVVFDRFSVDPRRIAIGGFSDGASYAITLGLTNGDLFQTVLAFSPGFYAASHAVGQPRVYISHGRRDAVLPFSRTGEPLARQLTAAGFEVRFDVFEGGHTVPANKITAALDWWLAI
jgi:phospholipase/carboxylesterase